MSRVNGAGYMEWAKQVPPRARYSLAASGILPVTWEELGVSPQGTVGLSGPNEYGDVALREALAAREGLGAPECLLAEGCSMVNLLLAGALVEPGRAAIVESPGYEPLRRAAEFFGAEIRYLPRRFGDRFQPDLDALERELARGGVGSIWLTNPHNPSGIRTSRETLAHIHARARSAGAALVVDEVYREFFEDQPSAISLGPGVFVTTSFTKVFGLPGIRIGWALGDAAVMDRARRLHGIFSAQTAWPSVCIARAAAPRMDALAARARRIAKEGRARYDAFLSQHPQLAEIRPEAGLISFPKLPEGTDDLQLIERLLAERQTVAVPGSYFLGPGHLRIAIGAAAEELDQALRRLGAALQSVAAPAAARGNA